MKIGLVRHFKVRTPEIENRLNSSEFNQIMQNYDHSPVIPSAIQIDADGWDLCYASTLSRAVETAKTIYRDEIINTDLIVEVPLSSFMNTNIPLPNMVWHVGGRIAWLFSCKSQIEDIKTTKQRIKDFMKLVEESGHKKILVVSHGFFMKVFASQLKKYGYSGAIDFAPKNGKLYLFEK
ncbi:MAG: histidine phosphatase family protein [Bacteroidota bacterium]